KSAAPAPAQETALKADIGRTRFIIGLERAVEFQVFALTNPNRVFIEMAEVAVAKNGKGANLVLEIVPADSVVDAKLANARRALMQAGAAALGAGGLQPPMPRPAVSPQVQNERKFKPVLVIDPGHDADDTGA